ncbi:uncharacterized protein LOC133899246 [Phragmites australis]|uniref:uncharacterized protein LOC133899246 n=1 Tax=Phragmites australis TaxID=29695 RepID=UPI002D793655|nr:uncharacterized protein LOC133899246 [Phragmites australis]
MDSSQRVGDGDCQHGETLRYSIPYLPEDIWCHIHSLMPMCDAARAACLSRAFLRFWRSHPILTLDWETLNAHLGNFSGKIDSILRNHSGSGLKILELDLDDDDSTFPHVNSWLQAAVTPGIEELTLTLHKKYNFPCSLLSDGVRNSIRYLQLNSCTFRPTAGLGPLRTLTSLCLHYVRITGDELECLLSNSLALRQLFLYDCKEIIFLKIPCVLQQLSCLTVTDCWRLQVIEIKAPNLSSIDLNSGEKIKLSLGEALQMKALYMQIANAVCYARAELPSIMPNLETLQLASGAEAVNTPVLPTKFLYLKHLTISLLSGMTFSPSYDYLSLASFFDASPSLETLFLNVSRIHMEHESVLGGSSHLRQLPEHRLDCLKSVEIVGFSSAKSLVELTCCIVKNAVSLECLMLDTLHGSFRCSEESYKTCSCSPISKTALEEATRAIVAIRTYVEDKVPPTAKMTVLEPCKRCHSSG